MGMPISNYTVLKALGYGGAPYEVNTALDTLRPFNLFAFIIHDPEAHPDFDRRINHRFDYLDYVTGDKLLFFALVDPPPEWLEHAGHRHYYRHLTSRQTQELLDPKHAINSTDKGITAFSLANSLKIPTGMLPCIVITPDFRSEQFIWFKTCPDHVEEQLKKLGYIAERSGESVSELNRALLFEIIRREGIDLCEGNGTESLESSLAKALTDVLSFIIAGNNRDSWLKRQALEQAQNTIVKLHATLTTLKRNFDESDTEELDRLCLNIVSFISQLNTQKDLNLDEFIAIDKAFLENDSYQILKTAHRVFNLLMSEQLDEAMPDLEESVDYTPGVICLAKVFEREVNLSVVHWIRKELGIILPPYFNKHQPSVRARFVPGFPGGRAIDFNMERRGKWLPPGIGQSEIACKDMARTKMPHGWVDSSWNLLLTRWRVIREERNEAAHTELVDENSVLVVKSALDELSRHQVFERLYRMKVEYSGSGF
jgi:hypothetical protein